MSTFCTLDTTQGQLQISKTCTIEKNAPNDTRRPQWPPKANGALNPPRQGIHHARDLSSRGARRSVGGEDLRTRQSSLRAAGGYAGGGRAGSNRQATPALVASAFPSTATTYGQLTQGIGGRLPDPKSRHLLQDELRSPTSDLWASTASNRQVCGG